MFILNMMGLVLYSYNLFHTLICLKSKFESKMTLYVVHLNNIMLLQTKLSQTFKRHVTISVRQKLYEKHICRDMQHYHPSVLRCRPTQSDKDIVIYNNKKCAEDIQKKSEECFEEEVCRSKPLYNCPLKSWRKFLIFLKEIVVKVGLEMVAPLLSWQGITLQDYPGNREI